jgi:hypothetical protein
MMLILSPTAKQIKLAEKRERTMRAEIQAQTGRTHLRNSITAGAGTLASLVCEVCLREFYDLEFSPDDEKHDYDLVHPLRFGKIDNKTKIRTVAPKPEYLGTVASYNTRQQCDFYCFTSILKDFSQMWIAGFMPKAAFGEQAVFHKKGDIDPSSDRGWRFKADCWNMPYGDMWTPPEPDKIDERYLVSTSVT